jgi:hypothetical protein
MDKVSISLSAIGIDIYRQHQQMIQGMSHKVELGPDLD